MPASGSTQTAAIALTADDEGNWEGSITELCTVRGTWKPSVAEKTEDVAARPADENLSTFEARNRVTVLPGARCTVAGQLWIVQAVKPGLSGVTTYTLRRPLPGPF